MTLVSIPSNPVPEDVVSGTIKTPDGAELRFARWAPPAGRKGTVCVFTGRSEHIEKYFETIGELVERGFSVVAMDWRGQGLSARELPDANKGHIDDFDMFERDLEALRKQVLQFLCPQPWFALAHSMAGAVLLSQANSGRSPFERLVLVSPMIEIAGRATHTSTRVVVEIADAVGLGASYAPGVSRRSSMSEPFEGNDLTSDAGRYARNAAIVAAAPQLAVAGPTIGWINAIRRGQLQLHRGLDVGVPNLILRSDHTVAETTTAVGMERGDAVLDVSQIARWAGCVGNRSTIVPVADAKHDVLLSLPGPRAVAFAELNHWLDGYLQSASPTTQHEQA